MKKEKKEKKRLKNSIYIRLIVEEILWKSIRILIVL